MAGRQGITPLTGETGGLRGVYYISGPDKLGFAALPAGYRFDASIYNNATISATWWSGGAGESDPLAPTQSIYDYRNTAYASHTEKSFGLSVRCVKN